MRQNGTNAFRIVLFALNRFSARSLAGVNTHTILLAFHKLPEVIIQCEQEKRELTGGKIKLRKNSFGGVHKGKKETRTGGQKPFFGLLKCNEKVRYFVIPHGRAEKLHLIIVQLTKLRPAIKTILLANEAALPLTMFQFFGKSVRSTSFNRKLSLMNAITSIELKIQVPRKATYESF